MNGNKQPPTWKNPRERLKCHLTRKSSGRCLDVSLNNSNTISEKVETESCPPIRSFLETSNTNPFRRGSPVKKKKKVESLQESTELKYLPVDWDDSNANDSFSSVIIDSLSNSQMKIKRKSLSRISSADPSQVLKECFPLDFSGVISWDLPRSTIIAEEKTSEFVPKDLRIGSKMRIISKKPFPWMRSTNGTGNVSVRITGAEKYEGLKCFMNSLSNVENLDDQKLVLPTCSSSASLLEAASLFWQFPSLPWISLFPRIDSLLKSLPKQTAPPMAPSMVDVLNRQWVECFDQLFLSWKKGDRKTFYVACPTFTVLFTKSSEVDSLDLDEDSMSCFQTACGLKHVAIVTPTNSGFRQYLKSEGINYEICSNKKRHLSKGSFKLDDSNLELCGVTQSQPPIFDRAEKEIETDGAYDRKGNDIKDNSDSEGSPDKLDQSADHDWLETMGVSPSNAARLRRYKSMGGSSTNLNPLIGESKIEKEKTTSVLIKGPSVQAFYNLLQTSRVCRAIAGPHANLPPTLIACQPFLYGQMQSLKKTSQVLKRNTIEYIVEMENGPVLPHAVAMVVEFVRKAGLCEENPVIIRVNDKNACNGLNSLSEDLTEWTEISVETNTVRWST